MRQRASSLCRVETFGGYKQANFDDFGIYCSLRIYISFWSMLKAKFMIVLNIVGGLVFGRQTN